MTEAVIVRPVLVTVVAAVSSGVTAVMTPVTRLTDLVTPTLPIVSGCSATGSSTVGQPTSRVPPTGPTSGVVEVTSPARSLPPDPPPAAPPPAAAPRAAPPAEVTPAASAAGAMLGWHRPATGRPGAGSGSTSAPTGFPQRPHTPGGDGVTGADGGPGPLRGMTLDACQVPATASARSDVSPPRRHAGRFPGVAARPG
ncbi:hypothetical protein [Micromonospora sp. NPDC000442]|uniref:hypothetical protein n=1 Tax=Micromonospora sp. NPDC000442 TaxID=3364217 RepID=UPI00367F4989